MGSVVVLLVGLVVATVFPCAVAFAGQVSVPNDASMSSVNSSSSTGPSAVAQVRGSSVALYQSPSSKAPYRTLEGPTSSSGSLVFLVSSLALSPEWVQVYLPIRPNGSKAWVQGITVRLSSDRYLVRVDLSTHALIVFDGSREVITAPVGVGRSVLPTPTGTYFLARLFKQPDPSGEYGPYAFGLSAFSDVLQSFGGGPGEIGLHGTDDPQSVGANVSHGCLRVTDAMITKLANLLPLGTPVNIVG